ncbi:hypothetical protein ACFQ60_01440 [Streptomyces zhihengii]
MTFEPVAERDAVAGLHRAIALRRTSRTPSAVRRFPSRCWKDCAARPRPRALDWTSRTTGVCRNSWTPCGTRSSPNASRRACARRSRAGRPGARARSSRASSSSLGPRRYDGRAPVRTFPGHDARRDREGAVFEWAPCLAVRQSPGPSP